MYFLFKKYDVKKSGNCVCTLSGKNVLVFFVPVGEGYFRYGDDVEHL